VVVFWFHVLYVFGLAAYPTLRKSVLERRSACSRSHVHVYTRWSVCTAVVLTTEVTVTYLLRVAKMPFVFSHVEYCDIHFVYGFCNGNALAAVEEYQRRFPDRRIPSRSVFTRIHQTLRDTGSLRSVPVQSERKVVRTITETSKLLFIRAVNSELEVTAISMYVYTECQRLPGARVFLRTFRRQFLNSLQWK
jgi:hypothetical protein